MNISERTTIAAISTAMSTSGIGIVRMSGEEAFAIADSVFEWTHGPFSGRGGRRPDRFKE